MSEAFSPALRSLLRKVEKPGRYIGGEYGTILKPGAGFTVALSYPDLYEIAMSNAAVKILYSLLNAVPDVACERVFAPAQDYEQALKAAGLPLCSLETATPLSRFDVVAFSFGYELTLTNLLAILESGGVPVETAQRGLHDPIVLVGGPSATNPAPLSPFADAVFIGEAEGWIQEIFAELAARKRRGAARGDLLDFLRSQPCIWFPGVGRPVRRAFWRGFATTPADTTSPVPSMRVVQDHGAVEIMRGCPNACKFCHATVLYRPSRLKQTAAIRDEVRALVERCGYREISLSSLSSGDFREIHGLVRELNRMYGPRKVSFSLPSLRVDSLSLGLLKEISEVRKSGLTFAVETARPDWQKEVRKNVTLDKVIELLKEARTQGWKAAKFYFMVGLPPSFDEDESTPIVEFLRAVRAATGMSINVNVASYIPKPHTPWQRAAQMGEEQATERIMSVKKNLAGDGFKIGYHAPILSLLEGIVARGDTRAGLLVLDAYRRGARLDAWEEHVRLDVWREAIAAADWDVVGETCRARAPTEPLPWEGIALALSTSEIREAPPETAGEEPTSSVGGPIAAVPTAWKRVLFSFTKTGAAAFISHLDLMTVFERAIARAAYAARFTEGFNPKPRLEFANPLSLGLDSLEEIASVDLHDYDDQTAFLRRMNAALPDGLRVTRAQEVPPPGTARRRSLMSAYWGADFEVTGIDGAMTSMRLPATGLSIRKSLEAAGTWERATALRTRSWAIGTDGEPISYFDYAFPSTPDSSALT